MKRINLREDKGVTMTDVIVAMIILSLFVGIIGSLFYNIAYYNNSIRMNAIAVHYAVKIAEDTDKMTYEEVEETLNQDIKSNYEIQDGFNAYITVEKYNKDDDTKKDIIKIVTIKVNYQIMNETKSYELKKLKIKE